MDSFPSDAERTEGTMAIAGSGGTSTDNNAPPTSLAPHTAEVMVDTMAIAVSTRTDAHNTPSPHTAEVMGVLGRLPQQPEPMLTTHQQHNKRR